MRVEVLTRLDASVLQTSGMDPNTRRHIWDFIASLKQGRLVVLTTHSMEEADALGDKIAIVGSGTLQCVGTSLHLKQRYGTGYRLTLMTEEFRCPTVISQIKAIMPGTHPASCCCFVSFLPSFQIDGMLMRLIVVMMIVAEIQVLDAHGGSLVLSVPVQDLDTCGRLFDYLQNETYFNGVDRSKVILQWGISNTTLEDVFLTVAKYDVSYYTNR